MRIKIGDNWLDLLRYRVDIPGGTLHFIAYKDTHLALARFFQGWNGSVSDLRAEVAAALLDRFSGHNTWAIGDPPPKFLSVESFFKKCPDSIKADPGIEWEENDE